MSIQDFSSFYDKPCKIKLRSGKEVYGVIWKNHNEDNQEHFFASSKEYEAYKSALLDEEDDNNKFSTVNINDVVSVESLESFLGNDN